MCNFSLGLWETTGRQDDHLQPQEAVSKTPPAHLQIKCNIATARKQQNAKVKYTRKKLKYMYSGDHKKWPSSPIDGAVGLFNTGQSNYFWHSINLTLIDVTRVNWRLD